MTSYTIKDLPASERPRERLRKHGADALSDAELLALVIRAGSERGNVLELAREILSEFDLQGLGNASLNELKGFEGVGEVKAGQLRAVAELCRRFSTGARISAGERIRSFQDAILHLEEMRGFPEERVGLICLDGGNTVLSSDLGILQGSVDRVRVDARVIVREAVRQNSAGVILAHNHPSGNPEPSENDVEVTGEVRDALETVGVELLDHIVVGEEFTSLRKEGHL